MIDPSDDLSIQVEKQAKIIKALMDRANHQHELGGSAYSLFQSAIGLQNAVSEKSRDLEKALTTLGRASNKLESSEEARAKTQRTLADALESMEGGFAHFAEGKLQVFNDFFKRLIPDVTQIIQPGLTLSDYFDAVADSTHVRDREPIERMNLGRSVLGDVRDPVAPTVISLRDDRWFVISYRRTRSNNTVVLQTEITAIVRSNRLEKDRLIDAQENFLQAAFDNMPQGVCTFSAEGTMLMNNTRFGDLLTLPIRLTPVGTAFAQVMEYLRAEVLTGDFPHDSFEGLTRHLRSVGNLKRRVGHVNGKVLDIDIHPLPMGGCIVNVLDVTAESQTTEMLEKRVQARTAELVEANQRLRRQHEEQTRTEEDLRVAKAEVEAAMTSKTKFFAAASHDLLQPVNAAKLLISNLADQSANTDMQENVKRLDGSFRSMESLLRALLDISRLEATGTRLAVSSFALDGLLLSIRDDMGQLAAGKGLRFDVVPSGLWVKSDPSYLLRSIQNLVDNAIQYTDEGRILVGCRRRSGKVVVEVWDTGIGISRNNQERIFNEFARVDNSTTRPGMGLGLSIVDRACRHLGHRVQVRSKPGVGSVFSIELPVAVADRGIEVSKSEILDAPAEEMDLIVLLIENDPEVLFAMTQTLERWGAGVLAAKSTNEALDLIRDIGIPPDIILADYQLDNDDNGISSIDAVRKHCRHQVPAIMITASRREDLMQHAMHHQFSVMTKPVQLSRLRPLIDWKTRKSHGPDHTASDQSLP